MKKEFLAKIENKDTIVSIDIERIRDQYCVTAMVNGFDLCCLHYGYMLKYAPANTRLRSKKSIDNEIADLYNQIKKYVLDIQDDIIITSCVETHEITSNYIHTSQGIVDLQDIRSLESSNLISWYYHDVYKKNSEIEITIIRNSKTKQLQYFASDSQLYDQDKLIILHNSDSFKNNNYAFFFYDEVKRLLGLQYNNLSTMSGLFR